MQVRGTGNNHVAIITEQIKGSFPNLLSFYKIKYSYSQIVVNIKNKICNCSQAILDFTLES